MSLANPMAPAPAARSGTRRTRRPTTTSTRRGNLIYQVNYRGGLRVKSTSTPGTPTAPVETAHFDTWPEDNTNMFNGLWNNYPYFPSGVVIGSDIEKGLFVWWVGTRPSSRPRRRSRDRQSRRRRRDPGADRGRARRARWFRAAGSLHFNDGSGW
jgi:hypothetical protein